MKFSEKSLHLLYVNNIDVTNKELVNKFIKELRVSLRLDYELTSQEIKKLNANDVVEKWFQIYNLPENIISGS